MPIQKPAIYAEVDGAMSHRACVPGGPIIACPILQGVVYEDPAPSTTAAIRYWQAQEGSRSTPRHLLRHDFGRFVQVARMEGPANNRKMVGLSVAQIVDFYEQGVMDFRHAYALPEIGWTGREFDATRRTYDLIREAGLTADLAVYLDALGELGLDWWGGSDPSVASACVALIRSARFRARINQRLPVRMRGWSAQQLLLAMDQFSPDFAEAWPAVDYELRSVVNRTAASWLRAAGFAGSFIVAGSASPARPIVREDGRKQPSSEMQPGQMHNVWFYSDGADADGRVRTATRAAMAPASFDAGQEVWTHFDLGAELASTVSGILAATRGPSIVWGDPPSLNRLSDLAAAVAVGSN